ncbi:MULTISPECIES: DUF3302 domain-containing protein [Vibrio]|uniref:DUF3302 domain-containing protein n=1 Tax=Vibrio TaxID=662 RepID=UPI0007BC6142|nr:MULTISPECIES: DUF3302 domain-containing protein [Vibrio]MCG9627803.1 DUF3302 domain-containing protein [Vibrio mediterranei]OIN25596.1 hypothetical protein AWH66_2015065 [Vibrio barjaei]
MNLILDYASLAILFIVILIFIYGLIVVHDIPYEIAVKRQHPHQDAIHVAGWISLFFLHVLWPILWVWAMMYDPVKQNWAGQREQEGYDALLARLNQLEKQMQDKDRE